MKKQNKPISNLAKPKAKKIPVAKRFEWFGNDVDGLSIIDFLAAGMFIFFLVMKITHFILSLVYIRDTALVEQMNLMMTDINQNMYVIVAGYFAKKTIDTTVTKVGLFRSGQYEKVLMKTHEHNSNSTEEYEEPEYEEETDSYEEVNVSDDSDDYSEDGFQIPDDLKTF